MSQSSENAVALINMSVQYEGDRKEMRNLRIRLNIIWSHGENGESADKLVTYSELACDIDAHCVSHSQGFKECVERSG